MPAHQRALPVFLGAPEGRRATPCYQPHPSGAFLYAAKPGEILREEYLAPLGLSANALAHALHVPANRISALIAGKRNVTADTALRLGRALRTTPEFWLNLQRTYDLRVAEMAMDPGVKSIQPVLKTRVKSA